MEQDTDNGTPFLQHLREEVDSQIERDRTFIRDMMKDTEVLSAADKLEILDHYRDGMDARVAVTKVYRKRYAGMQRDRMIMDTVAPAREQIRRQIEQTPS